MDWTKLRPEDIKPIDGLDLYATHREQDTAYKSSHTKFEFRRKNTGMAVCTHREDGPAVIEFKDDKVIKLVWFIDGKNTVRDISQPTKITVNKTGDRAKHTFISDTGSWLRDITYDKNGNILEMRGIADREEYIIYEIDAWGSSYTKQLVFNTESGNDDTYVSYESISRAMKTIDSICADLEINKILTDTSNNKKEINEKE